MQVVGNEMLQAGLASWVVTHVMDALLSMSAAIQKLIWEDSMKIVVVLAEMLVIINICSAVIVIGVCLEWLAHVARFVGIMPYRLQYKYAPLRGFRLYGQLLRQL